ncbi:hypothetical protein FIU87_03240 [Bacillus sp. THAF10]|uniref:hypothetical protein n=1 Tax=Bacillus sp. THAF10 TaxID=2587848 RepID=UPI001268ADE2|nr:hypothetical protein [Bacillus sp. THAF10]QFT87656.1 hypothetical protein FIU87_03240 [Bacillus sp. THAF10]
MHPITAIEIAVSVVFVIIIFVTAFLLPRRFRKRSVMVASSITIALLLFFAVRPFWVDYQVSKKTEYLELFLEEKYPDQEWKISRQIGRQYNPYHLNVEFENEKNRIYTYSVVDEKNICQVAWMTEEGHLLSEGKHFERDSCEE